MQQIRRLDANLLTNYRDKKQIIGKPLLVNSASSRGVAANLRKLSNLADETLKTLWRRANMPADFALLAVGGFGRAQLFPIQTLMCSCYYPTTPNRKPMRC